MVPHHGVHIISAAGNHIIAVANPALALSNSLVVEPPSISNEAITIKRERLSPGPSGDI